MRRIDYIVVIVCATAAALCYINSKWSAPLFIISSLIGLFDSAKKKVLSAALINGIFLTLNIACLLRNLME